MCSIFDIQYMDRLGDIVQAFSVDRYGQPTGLVLVIQCNSEALSSDVIRYGPYRCRCSLRGYESWQEAIQHVNMILCERCASRTSLGTIPAASVGTATTHANAADRQRPQASRHHQSKERPCAIWVT